ncbi:hypothetical protein EV560_106316 [Bosea sp. BK604]|nr:hypothetical protein EV560_106316 [Bosea sp. BK604]
MGWLRRYERFWREKLDALEAFFNGSRRKPEPPKPALGCGEKDKDKS